MVGKCIILNIKQMINLGNPKTISNQNLKLKLTSKLYFTSFYNHFKHFSPQIDQIYMFCHLKTIHL